MIKTQIKKVSRYIFVNVSYKTKYLKIQRDGNSNLGLQADRIRMDNDFIISIS
jgi:hypothetical protein